ncbi:DUF6777 domain-containing protein [Streptomyces sp. NPDC101225]|uniref:DUF6777 domain-containing protein n=1 Tax=Streptomyces sp. NPDC101225 TaxID=3366135 RepID=UPI0037FBFCBE
MGKIAVLLFFVLALSGCDRSAPLLLVKAAAAGVPSLAPFFDENSGLGHDAEGVRPQTVPGSLQQGDTPGLYGGTPGLYGGTRQPTTCDVKRLKAFLTDPAQRRKARAWADALGIDTAGIPGYLDRLTPVLLRHDTLVVNHDYKKGKATPFNSLLQTGIAVLVDERGVPAVKCSCGNPLRPFTGDTHRISVTFDGGNKKWHGYRRSTVVAVRPAPREMGRLALVDVHDPGRGIDRPVGTTGARDSTFDAARRRAVPDLSGSTFADAVRELAAQGLASGYAGEERPPDDARVTASDPPAGAELEFGAYVTLSATGDTAGSISGPPAGPSAETPSAPSGDRSGGTPGGPSGDRSGGTPGAPSGGASGTAGTASGGSATPPSSPASQPSTTPPASPSSPAPPASGGPGTSSAGSTSAPPPGSPPPVTAGSSTPVTSSAPPPRTPVTSSAPPGTPVTGSAPPGTPVTTSAPAGGEPAGSASATRGPASSGPASVAIT